MKNSSSENSGQPVLVFDGDCAFCSRWVERWKSQARGKINFVPSQNYDTASSGVSPEDFKKSVYLFEPSRTSHGAEAVFRMLALGAGCRPLLWLYQHLPGFGALSEAAYRFAAGHRALFSQITKFFWGNDLCPDTYFISRKFFLKALAAIYAIAFVSLWFQIPGLYGPSGVLDTAAYLARISAHFKNSWFQYYAAPTLAWIDPGVLFLRGICAVGVLFSALIFFGRAVRLSFFLLWVLYLSLVSVGQDFLSFQWDILLLETGFFSIFWAPPQKGFARGADWQSEPVPFARILLQFLLFKLMFSSGVVKLASGDPVWRNLTALDFHYYTQPLPSPLSWFVHQLPAWFDKISLVFMFFVELAAPFLLFFPRRIRMAGVFLTAALQILIMLTGNYCFFNLLTIVLCLAAVDDSVWRRAAQTEDNVRRAPLLLKLFVIPVTAVFLMISSCQIARLFQFDLPWKRPALQLQKILQPFESINSYGLFAVMTKRRPEIVIEGSYDNKEWTAYEFRYKAGGSKVLPQFAAPYQPRLDWQMWFAALGRAEQNPWFINLCMRLLQGSPEVLGLLKNNPFPSAPPRYLRAQVYEYQFTDPAEKARTGAWWKREYRGVYVPVLSLAPVEEPAGGAKEPGTAPEKSADE